MKSTKSLSRMTLCVIVALLISSQAALAAVTPGFSGSLGFTVEGDKDGINGTAELKLNMKVDARGSNRAYLELGVDPGKKELGSTTYMWGNWEPRIRRAWVQHDGPFFHTGQTVNVRVGHSPTTISNNVGKIERFQGIRISNLNLFGANTMYLIGWDAATGALPRDEIRGISATTTLYGTDVKAAVLRSVTQEKTFWEIQAKRELIRSIELDALLFSDGFTHPYFYTFRAPLGANHRATLTVYDYGQFDTGRYHYTGEDYLHYHYKDKFSGIKGSVAGEQFGIAWELGYDSWDDLLVRHNVTGVKLSRDFGAVHVAFERERDGAIQSDVTHKLSLSTNVDVTRFFPGVKLGLTYDWAADEDQVLFTAEYAAPNTMSYKLQHGQDSGLKWSVQSSVDF